MLGESSVVQSVQREAKSTLCAAGVVVGEVVKLVLSELGGALTQMNRRLMLGLCLSRPAPPKLRQGIWGAKKGIRSLPISLVDLSPTAAGCPTTSVAAGAAQPSSFVIGMVSMCLSTYTEDGGE